MGGSGVRRVKEELTVDANNFSHFEYDSIRKSAVDERSKL
jgi:hypothetical protein